MPLAEPHLMTRVCDLSIRKWTSKASNKYWALWESVEKLHDLCCSSLAVLRMTWTLWTLGVEGIRIITVIIFSLRGLSQAQSGLCSAFDRQIKNTCSWSDPGWLITLPWFPPHLFLRQKLEAVSAYWVKHLFIYLFMYFYQIADTVSSLGEWSNLEPGQTLHLSVHVPYVSRSENLSLCLWLMF